MPAIDSVIPNQQFLAFERLGLLDVVHTILNVPFLNLGETEPSPDFRRIIIGEEPAMGAALQAIGEPLVVEAGMQRAALAVELRIGGRKVWRVEKQKDALPRRR